jgi:glycosyltransferase involved in cell wall biosynthesis
MDSEQRISVIIPALNEGQSIAKVIADLPPFVNDIIVVDNGSTDGTSAKARLAGATVLYEGRRGYGHACLCGLDHLRSIGTDIVVFIDGDYSDHPDELPIVVAPILSGTADFVVGSRMMGNRELGALLPQAIFGNWLATRIIDFMWSVKFTDLGPFRAIRMSSLLLLKMEDRTYGWTVEMQIKAAKQSLRCAEVAVGYRRRLGKSKISGTLSGTLKASARILYTLFRHALSTGRNPSA